jgi:multidrug efflux pump subunit AcrA (membrane-fusion protein)
MSDLDSEASDADMVADPDVVDVIESIESTESTRQSDSDAWPGTGITEPGTIAERTETPAAPTVAAPSGRSWQPGDGPPEVSGGDGRGRRRTALLVVGAAVVTGLVGMYIGTRIQSPADRAAAREAPTPSLITVPVERRELSSELVLSGTVSYNEPTVVQLAGSVGIATGEAAVITDTAAVGDTLQEGDIFVEVTGRPVMVLQGQLPMYRRMVIGSEGPDVLQLEESLVRQGYAPGTVDTVFDEATATAVEEMYVDAGYVAEGPSVEERDALTDAQQSVRSAEDNLRAAQSSLADASKPMLESERLQITQAVESARAAVPAAQSAAAAARTEGDQAVTVAVSNRDTARVARDVAAAARTEAGQPGAIDPNTGEPYTAAAIGQLDIELAQLNDALVVAEGAIVSAQTQRNQAVTAADQAVTDAQFSLQLAEAQFNEAMTSGDTTLLTEAVANAQTSLDTATANLLALQAATGTRISPGEIVFVPLLPSNVTEMFVTLGSTVQGPIGTLATAETLVSARVSRVDSALVAVGAAVTVEIRGSGATTAGTVLSVGAPAPINDGGEGERPSGGEASGRLEVLISPDDPDALTDYVFWDTRVVVSVASTDGAVLVVPVAALTVGPDEVSQVEVERTPATDTVAAVTEVVNVEVGLTSNGLAEVRPVVAGSLTEGDRVVIGFETNERQNEDDTEGPVVSSGETSNTDTGDDSADQGPDDSEGDSDTEADSPLAALMGWEFNPVEDRRKQLEVEEATADCMRSEGFEYEPVDHSAMSNAEDDLAFSDPTGFGEKYGYGVMRNYEMYEVGDGGAGVVFEDPNQEYIMGLDQDEQQTYYRTLYGAEYDGPSNTTPDGAYVPPPVEERGCAGIARYEIYGDSPGDDPEVQALLNEYYENQLNDPRLTDAYADWGECMAPAISEVGLEAPVSPDNMYSLMNRLKSEAQGLEIIEVSSQQEFDEYMNSSDAQMMGAEQNPDGSGVIYLGEPEEISGEEIDRLTGIEVELWKQDQACQSEAGIAELRREFELEVVEQITAEFPELAD